MDKPKDKNPFEEDKIVEEEEETSAEIFPPTESTSTTDHVSNVIIDGVDTRTS